MADEYRIEKDSLGEMRVSRVTHSTAHRRSVP